MSAKPAAPIDYAGQTGLTVCPHNCRAGQLRKLTVGRRRNGNGVCTCCGQSCRMEIVKGKISAKA